ncbi:hypothetical protein GS597_01880 [Synechococcales cyanobacterium C]|uniref:Prepilin-type N-terminal cleavage/methylation domain-containing protein n=1 Tax=Petrachloros mirabilis ULC683 TaxID=2781853 RepID=A0A8K2AGT0_9CYAN|nr:hypothetical protein [Petrachloros mirabilis]NCJ05284.1 hypothetical protein [Petrachloros mirabilis ULC683]
MANEFTKWKRFTPIYSNVLPRSSEGGLSAVELLVATLMAVIVVGLSLSLIVQQRSQLLRDRARSESHQNLQTAMEFIGREIQIAGERMEADQQLSAISIIGGDAVNSDQLILRRRLVSEVLPLCQTLSAGATTTTLVVALEDSSNCDLSDLGPDTDGNPDNPNPNGLTDNLDIFRAYRCAQDDTEGCDRTTLPSPFNPNTDAEWVWAYLYDPVEQRGEFFRYIHEDFDKFPNPTRNHIYAAPHTWQYTYTYDASGPAALQPRILLLEEQIFSVVPADEPNNATLQVQVNRQTPLPLVDELASLQVEVEPSSLMEDNGDFNYDRTLKQSVFTHDWQSLQGVMVTLRSRDPDKAEVIQVPEDRRQLSSRFLPRNVLSRPNN